MKNKQWSKKYKQCILCGMTNFKYRCKGLCVSCYAKEEYKRNKNFAKKQLNKKSEKKDYIKFLNKNPKYLKKYANGISFVCDGCYKQCRIKSPCQCIKQRLNILELKIYKELVIQECREKPINISS